MGAELGAMHTSTKKPNNQAAKANENHCNKHQTRPGILCVRPQCNHCKVIEKKTLVDVAKEGETTEQVRSVLECMECLVFLFCLSV
jgi:hypothetical protein